MASVARLATSLCAAAAAVSLTAAASASTATTSAPAPQPPSAAQLEAALLTQSDVGTPFTEQPTDSASPTAGAGSSTTVTGCEQLSVLLGGQPTKALTGKEVSFQAGDTGPVLTEALVTGTAAAVNAEFAKDSAAFKTCNSVTVDSQGTSITFKLTPISFAPAPVSSVRLDATYQGVRINGYLAIDHVGGAELGFFYLQAAGGSSQLATQYFQQADAKAHQYLTPSA